jgi:hypothetical protein
MRKDAISIFQGVSIIAIYSADWTKRRLLQMKTLWFKVENGPAAKVKVNVRLDIDD